jgi:hypothetical protein
MSAGPDQRPRGEGDGAEDAARPPARPSPPGYGCGADPCPGSCAPSPGSPAVPPPPALPPPSLWLELGPACMRAQQCPSESSGQTSGDLGTSSSSSAGLSPGSDSDSSGVVCGGRGGGGMRGALSRSWSLESLRSATAGKGAAAGHAARAFRSRACPLGLQTSPSPGPPWLPLLPFLFLRHFF